MTDQSFEQRLAAAIAAYADHAPTEVEPVTMARLTAARSRRIGPVWFGHVPAGRGLVVAVALLALLVTMLTGAFVAGGYPRERGPYEVPGERGFVEPFIGLPPEDALPSTPETGELIFSFAGRVTRIGNDAHLMRLYADGRLIWKRNLDSTTDEGRLAFGAIQPTTAVIEQRLTPEGVELLRAAVIAGGASGTPLPGEGRTVGRGGGPGLCCWGGLQLHDGKQLVDMTWSDPLLPGRLANPASWLPLSAWADQRISGYVPRQYAVCVDVPNGLAGVPRTARDLILANATDPGGIWNWEPDSECYLLPTKAAREIALALDETGIHLDEVSSGLASFTRRFFVFPVTPDGEPMCVTCG